MSNRWLLVVTWAQAGLIPEAYREGRKWYVRLPEDFWEKPNPLAYVQALDPRVRAGQMPPRGESYGHGQG